MVIDDSFEEEEDRKWWQELLHLGSHVARDYQADQVGEKLWRAADSVDIAGLTADGVLERAADLLRGRPVESIQESDFQIEIRIKEYGIAAGSWDARAFFFVKADVFILDGETGRRIWKESVDASDPVNPHGWLFGGTLANLVSARELSNLSVSEIRDALVGLADYSAVKVAEKLEAGLEKAGVR